MSAVYGIIKQNPGIINVYSESARGTVFRIYLHGHTSEPSIGFQKSTHKALSGHGETLLVVEDEAAIRKLTKHMLENLGYIVLTAESAKKALEISETHGHEIAWSSPMSSCLK